MNAKITSDYTFASWLLNPRMEAAQTEEERRLIQQDYERKASVYFAALRAEVGMNR